MIEIAKNIDDVKSFNGINLIVDFFRFSTTIVALCSRFKKIKVFSDEEKLYDFLDFGEEVVFSEKNLKLEKFDNSPYLAYTCNYSDRVCVITESGSKAVLASKKAKEVIILSLSNLDAVKNYISNKIDDILLVPACIFFDKDHLEDFIFCRHFLDYFLDKKNFDEKLLYEEIKKTSRIDQLLRLRKTAKEDLKIIFSKNIFDIIPLGRVYSDFAEVYYESYCELFRRP